MRTKCMRSEDEFLQAVARTMYCYPPYLDVKIRANRFFPPEVFRSIAVCQRRHLVPRYSFWLYLLYLPSA